MFTVVITEKGGEQRRLEFDKSEVNIGRVQGNDIILPKGNVSKRHSRIVLKDGKFIIVDLKSTNGTYVNGRKITSPLVIKNTDKIYIGDFIIHVEDAAGDALGAPPPGPAPGPAPAAPEPQRRPPPPPPRRKPRATVQGDRREADRTAGPMADRTAGPMDNMPPADRTAGPVGPPPAMPPAPAPAPIPVERPPERPPADRRGGRRGALRDTLGPDLAAGAGGAHAPIAEPEPPPPQRQPDPPPRQADPAPRQPRRSEPRAAPGRSDPRREKISELQKEIHDRLIEYLDLRRMDIDRLADEELWEKTENAICDIVESMDGEGSIPAFVDQDMLIKDVLNEALGLGPLEDLLADDTVDEIMVNRSDQIYVERGGRIEITDRGFSSDKAVLGVIERIVAPLGRRIDESSPLVDARLKDGSRVNAIIPPLALKGPCVTIRKFRTDMLGSDDMVRFSSLSQGMVNFLEMCVSARKNIVISGGTGSGKTTTLNVVSNFIPDTERIVSIEDAAELQLKHDHWVQLESRPPNIEGKGAVFIRDLVRNSLRMRPDRVIVGECRGGEALDMLQAMNTGHDGSLTTAHSNSPRDTLSRLETMVLMAGMDLPIKAIREQVASAIDIIAHQSRFSDGSRRLTHITEVTGMEGEIITMQDIFTFKQEGFDEQGRVQGRFVPSGFVPRFYEDLQRRGLPVNMDIFRE